MLFNLCNVFHVFTVIRRTSLRFRVCRTPGSAINRVTCCTCLKLSEPHCPHERRENIHNFYRWCETCRKITDSLWCWSSESANPESYPRISFEIISVLIVSVTFFLDFLLLGAQCILTGSSLFSVLQYVIIHIGEPSSELAWSWPSTTYALMYFECVCACACTRMSCSLNNSHDIAEKIYWD